MLRILGRKNSFNVRKVLWTCDEIGIPFVREDWGRGFKPTSTPEFLMLNPVAQVPCVIDDGFVMRESHAIVRYLCAKHHAHTLYPEDLQERQRVDQWLDWISYDITHSLRGAFLGGQLKEPPWNNEWFVNQGRRDLIAQMKLLNDHLAANGPYLLGGQFTLADISAGLVVNRWFSLAELQRPDYPALTAYYELLTERPAYREHGRNGLP